MAPEALRCDDPRLTRAVSGLVGKLKATVPSCPYDFRVIVVNEPVVNAFALPGGAIVVYRGLLEQTDSPEELAGVLAHEMQHVLRRHITKRIIQDSSVGLLLAAMSGDTTGSIAYGLESARLMALMRFSRQDEREADSEGLRMLLAAGGDPRGMIGFFTKLEKQGSLPPALSYLSTHPDTAQRVADLKGLVRDRAGRRPVFRPMLKDADWAVLRKACFSRDR
jgi:predicted Zn-dependent protease